MGYSLCMMADFHGSRIFSASGFLHRTIMQADFAKFSVSNI